MMASAPDDPQGNLSPPAVRPGRRPRGPLLALLALVVAGLASSPFLWLDSYGPTLLSGGDGAIYVICAQNMLAGEGYTYLGEPFIIRPPGFSVLLMPLIALFGRDTSVLTLAVWLCGIAGMGAFFWYQRPRLGTALSLAVCAVLFLNPFFQLAANQIMSDVPALLALFACLLLERRTRLRPSLAGDLALGAAIGAATYLRSVHLLLLPALALARAFGFLSGRPASAERGTWRELPRHGLRRVFPVFAVALLALLPWKLREDRVAPEGVAELTRLHSYKVALLHQDPADPDSPRLGLEQLGERFVARAGDVAGTLGSRMVQREYPSPARKVVAVLLLLSLAIVSAVRRGTGDWFVAGTLLVISVYFGFMNRLMLPVFFMVVPAAAQLAFWILRRWLPARSAQGVAAVLVLAWAAADFDRNEAYHATMEREHADFLATCDLLREAFTPEEVLSSSRSAHLTLELDRPVLNHNWPMLRLGQAGTLEFLERHDVRGLVLTRGRLADRQLMQALGARLEELDTLGPYTVARLHR